MLQKKHSHWKTTLLLFIFFAFSSVYGSGNGHRKSILRLSSIKPKKWFNKNKESNNNNNKELDIDNNIGSKVNNNMNNSLPHEPNHFSNGNNNVSNNNNVPNNGSKNPFLGMKNRLIAKKDSIKKSLIEQGANKILENPKVQESLNSLDNLIGQVSVILGELGNAYEKKELEIFDYNLGDPNNRHKPGKKVSMMESLGYLLAKGATIAGSICERIKLSDPVEMAETFRASAIALKKIMENLADEREDPKQKVKVVENFKDAVDNIKSITSMLKIFMGVLTILVTLKTCSIFYNMFFCSSSCDKK